MKLKVLELFGGIGACSKALERLGIDYEIADYVEIDKYAVKSFNAIHNTNFEPQDICEWDKDIEVDLIMHGSPCQDFSLAGKQAGGNKDSGTRSSLMYETIRIVKKLRPRYVIWENVKNLLSKNHVHNFEAYLNSMEELGYVNYYKVLNAKDYGIPQNRERVFTISILGNENYEFPKGKENTNKINRLFNFSARQDCRVIYDENGLCPTLLAGMGAGGGKVPMFIEKPFEFPLKQELKLKLKDMLEEEVDEKYYLSDKMINFFYKNEQVQKEKGNGFRFNVTDGNVIAKTTTTRAGCRMDDNFLKIRNATKKGYLEAYERDGVDISSRMQYHRGNVQKDMIQTLTTSGGNDRGVIVGSTQKHAAISTNGIVPTLTGAMGQGGGHVPMHNYDLRIRKLTPKECFRLMGFDDEDYEKAAQVNSNTQLYKQAGNSIVVNVLEAILTNLLNQK